MPKAVSPLQVGTFVLVALCLALGMILFFSTTTIFSRTESYILYFQDSVKGLSVGSSVKFKGVPIGQVKRIYINYNQSATSARVPVLIEVEAEQLRQLADMQKTRPGQIIQQEVEKGLRGQLQMDSYITGLLFIELNYFPGLGAPQYFQKNKLLTEIPTVRTPLSDLGNSANDLINRLSAIDYAGLASEVRQLAATLNKVDIAKVNSTLASIDVILAQAKDENIGQNMGVLVRKLTVAADNFGDLSDQLSATVQGENEQGAKIADLVENLSSASASFARLADYLEQNPSAILTGKNTDEE